MKVEIINLNHLDFRAIAILPFMSQVDWDRIGYCYDRSDERWIGTVDGEMACMWGLIPPSLMSDTAYLWLFHTDLVEEHKFSFVRHSQIQMQRMLKSYPIIVGDCQIDNPIGRRWLTWLGAKFESAEGALTPFKIKAFANG